MDGRPAVVHPRRRGAPGSTMEIRFDRLLTAQLTLLLAGCDVLPDVLPKGDDYCSGADLPDGWEITEGYVAVAPGSDCPAPEDVIAPATWDCCPVYEYQGETCELVEVQHDRPLPSYYGSTTTPTTTSDTGATTTELFDLCVYNAVFSATDICCGRPLLADGHAVVAEVAPDPRWAAPGAVALDGVPARDRARLAAWWARAAQLEHASIASFARFTLDLMRFGAPPALLADAHRAGLDEIAHARACFAVASACAGRPLGAGPLPLDDVDAAPDRGAFAEALVREGCVGETLAALDAGARLRRATDPEIRRVLQRIVDDESRHAALAWRTLAWLLADDADGALRARVDRAFEAARAQLPGDLAPGAAVPSHGLVDEAERIATLRAGWDRVIDPSRAARASC
ncbi:MAG: ferritin-like domain-containing protein [Myxococcota bacterium]